MLGLGHGIHTDTAGLAEIFANRYALTFNGTDEYVQVDTLAGDISVTKGTISAWVIWDNSHGASQCLFQARVDSNNVIQLFWHNSADEIRFTYKAGGTAKVVAYEADQGGSDPIFGANFPHDTLVHIVMTWDTTAASGDGELKGYINGTQVGSTVTDLAAWSGTISTADIGQNTQDAAYFEGQIDELSIWTDVMSVSALYNSKVKRDIEFVGDLDRSKLIGYYQFEEGSGTTTIDESGTGNTGTLVNTPTWTAL